MYGEGQKLATDNGMIFAETSIKEEQTITQVCDCIIIIISFNMNRCFVKVGKRS
jgi:hypothetical protein